MTRAGRALAAIGLTAGLVGVPVAPVRASSTICVGIVVDYGVAKPGGGANSLCVRVPVGANGADVLAARARALGRPAPTYRSDGLLCTIDGYPNDGSCASRVGGFYRYWGYYHQLAGSSSWVYSRTGPSYFTVASGSVEGWSFQNGESPPGRAPPPVSYGSICGSLSSPTPTASPTPRPSPEPTASRPTPGSGVGRSSSPADGGSPAAARPSTTGSKPRGPATPSAGGTTATPSSPGPPSAAPRVIPLSPAEPRPRSPSRPPVATLAGVALAGGIGAAAVLRARSRRRAGR